MRGAKVGALVKVKTAGMAQQWTVVNITNTEVMSVTNTEVKKNVVRKQRDDSGQELVCV